jgi:Uma2 family endonuclease
MCVTETLTRGTLNVDDLDALYPDGEPLPESEPHEILRTDIVTVLREHFRDTANIWVSSNRNVYYREGEPTAVIEPDLLVVAGVSPAELADIKSYRTFQHGGTPLFVLEVLESDSFIAEMAHHRPDEARREDLDYKRTAYAAIGVAEYWRVDPTGGDIAGEVLKAERLTDDHWTPIPVTVDDTGTWRGHSATLNLDIAWTDRELLFYLPGHHEPLPNLARSDAARRAERHARQAAESARRAERHARREAERKAEAAEAEVARLRELLRRNGSSEDGWPHNPPG